jgi:alpha-N-arabinofuranosidase
MGHMVRALAGSNPGFLVQQNSMRDAIVAALNLNIFARHAGGVRMANIAQLINVLQAMIMTDKEKMVLTPTYYVYTIVCAISGLDVRARHFQRRRYNRRQKSFLPRLDAIAARDKSGKLWLAITNVDPNQSVEVTLAGISAKSATGEDPDCAKGDSVNTFRVAETQSCRKHSQQKLREES